MDSLCPRLLLLYVHLYQNVHSFLGNAPEYYHIRTYRPPIPFQPVSGKHLGKSSAGFQRHEDADGGPDCRNYSQHHLRSAADLRHVRPAKAWHLRRCHCNSSRLDRGGSHGHKSFFLLCIHFRPFLYLSF